MSLNLGSHIINAFLATVISQYFPNCNHLFHDLQQHVGILARLSKSCSICTRKGKTERPKLRPANDSQPAYRFFSRCATRRREHLSRSQCDRHQPQTANNKTSTPNYLSTVPKNLYSYSEVKKETVFDRRQDRYLILVVGWEGHRYEHGCTVHIDIVDDKVWIQRDGTEEGIALALEESGISKEHMS